MTKDEAMKLALEALSNAYDALQDGDTKGCQ
jgi:20S proteasome alpha/beta subunit